MIRLTRINHVPLVLNSDLIEHIETTPDTLVSLTNGQKFMVLESAADVIDRVIDFRRAIFHSGFNSTADAGKRAVDEPAADKPPASKEVGE